MALTVVLVVLCLWSGLHSVSGNQMHERREVDLENYKRQLLESWQDPDAAYGGIHDEAVITGAYERAIPVTEDTAARMKELNQCGNSDSCDSKRFHFLLTLAGIKHI